MNTNRPESTKDRVRYSVYVLLICMGLNCLSSGCRAITYQDPAPAPFSSSGLRVELKALMNQVKSEPDQVRSRLERLIPNWSDTQALLKGDLSETPQIAERFKDMRVQALRELPWALRAAQDTGLSEVKVHRVGLRSGSDNAHGDVALLAKLKLHDGLYTVTFHQPNHNRGLRLSGWVYQHDYGWRCLLKLGEHLEAVSTSPALSP